MRHVPRFLLRRLLVTLPVVLGICFATFVLVRLGSGDPAAIIAGPLADADAIERVRRDLDLGRPVYVQFATWLRHLLQGDLGTSWQSGLPVAEEIAQRFPVTLELVLLSLAVALLVAIPAGLQAAFAPGGAFDQVTRALASLAYAIPTFWLALMAIYVCFFRLRIAPAPMGRLPIEVLPPPAVTGSHLVDGLLAGDGTVVQAQLASIWLPALCFGLGAAAPLMKQMRAIAAGVIGSEHMRLARAYGLPRRMLWRIALRNSFVPIVTFVGSELTGLLAAAALVELIFSWGGLGAWGLNAILAGDFAAVQGYVLVLSLFSVTVFLLIDLLVLIAEPRAGRA